MSADDTKRTLIQGAAAAGLETASPQRILLTGATGFVGSHVARLLVQHGHKISAVIRPTSETSRITDVLPMLDVIACDLADSARIKDAIDRVRPEVCVHLAWHLTPGTSQTDMLNIDCLTTSFSLARQLAASGCRRMAVTGSCFEYNAAAGLLSETSATKPTSLYSACKISLLTVLEQLSQATGIELAWLRLFPLYGPYEDYRRLIPAVIQSLLLGEPAKVTAGEQVRDYLHVEDAAEAIWCVTQSTLTGVVNIGSGRPVVVSEMIKLVAESIGRPDLLRLGALPYRSGDAMSLCADNGRLRGNTAWRPRYELEPGLEQTIDWWRERISR